MQVRVRYALLTLIGLFTALQGAAAAEAAAAGVAASSAAQAASTPVGLTVAALLVGIGMAALLMPCVFYLAVGWSAKRKDIMDGLDADARLAYFEMFSRADAAPAPADAMQAFEDLYAKWYGRRLFVAPGVLLALAGLAATTLVAGTSLHRVGYLPANPLFDVPDTAVAALAGAYLWVVNDLISRARRLDFAPANVQWAALRLIIAVPMGYAFASVASDSAGPFVAFALGAFPLGALVAMLQRLANRSLRIDTTAQESHDDVIKLQGVNRPILERLADEDVTTVTQIAYCDPVRLIMRSNLTFNFVTDCMNQALAWMYFEDQMSVLRPMGMRGAVEIKCLIDEFDDPAADGPCREDHDQAVAAMPKIAEKLGTDVSTLQVAFRQIAEDPYTIFLHRVWT